MAENATLANGATSDATLAIGVITFNRLTQLKPTLAAIARYTSTHHTLFIADDGSSDGTAGFLRERGLAHFTGRNRGIAWNKNRALCYLLHATQAQTIVLLEDDTYPIAPGWEQDWIAAAARSGHANLAGSWFESDFLSGSGSVDDPVISRSLSAQCAVFSRSAVQEVGFFDTRFRGFGMEHVDHSRRLARAGFGGRMEMRDGVCDYQFEMIKSSLRVAPEFSHQQAEQVAANQIVAAEIEHEPVYRAAWRGAEEEAVFRAEMAQCGLMDAAVAPARDRAERLHWWRRLWRR